MSIEDIKQIMDGFDPAALLPDLSTLEGKAELICRIAVLVGPVLLLALGIAYLLFAPREANYHFGYRCFFGMGSVDAWRFSQRLAGMVWGILGLVLTIVMLIVCGSFRGMEIMPMVTKAAVALAWQAGLTLLSSLAVNVVVMTQFDAKGDYRKKNKKYSERERNALPSLFTERKRLLLVKSVDREA